MIDFVREIWNRVLAVFRRTPLDADLDAEIAMNLQQAIEENVRSGMPPDEARRQALVRFGGGAQAVELHREARGLPGFEVLRQDLQFTMRTLRCEYALAAIVILVLAFGIGANVAVFSVVNTILLRPLPFQDLNALVWLTANSEEGGLSNQTYTVSAFEEFQRHNQLFQQVTSYQTFFNSVQYKLIGRSDPLPLVGVQVAENFFPTLGVTPALGRLFTPDECKKGGHAAALLSHSFWQRQFGGDPAIVGRTISIQATPAHISGPVTVVGVLPASFDFGAVFSPGMHVDFFVPAYMDFWRTWRNTLAVLGRLKPGVLLSQAQAESNMLFPQLRAAHKEWWTDYKSTLLSLRGRVTGTLGRSRTVLWCAVGLMLLIVCINVSNVFLARALSRGKEFAMRAALGAGRGRIVRQLLTESPALTGVGAALGFVLPWVITAYLARPTWIALPLLATVRVDIAALA
jgi:predicted permease